MSKMTDQLAKAYSQAGAEMGKQMGAAVVAIISEITSGKSSPCILLWKSSDCPTAIQEVLPKDEYVDHDWIMITSPELEEIPLMNGQIVWQARLASGHQITLLG